MIPLVDLKTQYNNLKKDLEKAINKVLSKTEFILGEEVDLFEEEFARYCSSSNCISVASGTDALYLSLRALNIGEGDEVITVANTFVATVLAITYTQAKIVLVDINPDTYNIDVDKIQKEITPNTKAILPVHLYGRPVEMDKIISIAKKYDLYVIEDACQAHGASFKGKRVGSFGDMGCFSFYPGKNLGAYGDGGAIVTSNKNIADYLKLIRNYGSPKKYYHSIIGYNSRLDTLQAAILRVKLIHLEEWNKKRLNNAKLYNLKLKGVGDLILPNIDNDFKHVFHLYVIRTKNRGRLLEYLKNNDIYCGIHYPVPIYSLEAFRYLGYKSKDFPVTEKYSKEILSLPMYPELNEKQIDLITEKIKDFFKNV